VAECKPTEREGFEPSRGSSPLLAFQASAFNRSTTSPNPQPTSSVGVLNSAALLAILAALLVGAASPGATRRAVAGHYNVPQPWLWKPTVGTSNNLIANASFESGSINAGWFQCGDAEAYVTREHPYDGAYDEYSGIPSGRGEPQGNSGVCQRVTIPTAGVLTARLYQLSNEENAEFAYQEADLLDNRGAVVLNLFKTVNDKAEWTLGRWNLAAYAGRTFWLYFGVHGDGYAKRTTEQFVDDVFLAPEGAPGRK
jgi:hypothetical protein